MHFETGYAEKLPAADDSIDVIVVMFTLHHVDVGRFVKECRRVLKPEGVALFYADHITELAPSDTAKRSTIVDEITEMNRKCYVIAESTSHPQRHILNGYLTLCDSIDWPGKKKIQRTMEIPSDLEAIRNYHLSVPFYARLGDASQNPMIQALRSSEKDLGNGTC